MTDRAKEKKSRSSANRETYWILDKLERGIAKDLIKNPKADAKVGIDATGRLLILTEHGLLIISENNLNVVYGDVDPFMLDK